MEVHRYDVPDDVDIENDGSTPDRPITNVVPPKKPRNRRKGVLIGMVALIIVLLIALTAVLLSHRRATAPASKSSSQSAARQKPPTPTTSLASGTSLYTSPADSFNLSFAYPSNWSVQPASGQSGNTITVSSPLVSLTDANGNSVPGKVTLTIRAGGSTMPEIGANAVIAQDSVQYAYAAPTAAQHQYFYVSFLHLPAGSSSGKGVFEEVVITGVNSLAKGSTATSDTFGGVDPLVSASFSQCATQTCSGTGASSLSVNAAAWQSDPTLQQLQKLFESFKFN